MTVDKDAGWIYAPYIPMNVHELGHTFGVQHSRSNKNVENKNKRLKKACKTLLNKIEENNHDSFL